MAIKGRKKVSVQYRKLDDLTGGFGGKTLQAAIVESMAHHGPGGALGDTAANRVYVAGGGYGTVVLNYYSEGSDFFFGEFVRFEPGADLPLVRTGEGVKAFHLTQAKAPSGHEPVRGVLYMMAIKNHALVIEGDVAPGRVEAYLSWLFGEASTTVTKGTHVVLLAELTPQAGGTQLSQVDEVVFKPKPLRSAEPDATSAEQLETVAGSARREVAETNTLGVLRAAGMDDADIRNLVEDQTELEVILQIRFKGKRRRRPVGIETANRLLRNVPEDELTLLGPGGRQREGRIVKLSYPANVEVVGSYLKTDDVARALYEGYKYFVSNGYID